MSLQPVTLARAGIAVAVAGGVALAVHADLHAKRARQVRQQADCAAWRRARETISSGGDGDRWAGGWLGVKQHIMADALEAPYMQALWEARAMVAYHPDWVWWLVQALRDPTYVGLSHMWGVTVPERGTWFEDHWLIVDDDLFTRAGRASWLLKQVTGRDARIVHVQTDRAFLADLARDWNEWLGGLDGGAVCWPP